ncbi:hypothetical protein [Caudoviricetes sp.]|nr:hypothetical protein [Caudoviricetes sp.]UOF81109.1 hypothetical protein [Caudoviricetes sp.]UOF82255.1 hypothetical protein [Caudoviricetes sp.]UOF82454.1 hypothetical protein [Caudoviricetes sp.]UOF82608.1 hypothetical protein [Caudoviricetes sp.]
MSQLHDRLTLELIKHHIPVTPELVNDLARAAKPPRPVTEQQRAVNALLSVTGWPSSTMYGRAATLAKALVIGSDYATVAADLETRYGKLSCAGWWWYRNDWRGLRGQEPDESGIRQTWKAWEKPPSPQPSRFDGLIEYLQDTQP